MMQAARIGERLPVALAMTLIAVSCAEYALSIAMQHSFPRDLNLAYMPLGLMYRQMAEQTPTGRFLQVANDLARAPVLN